MKVIVSGSCDKFTQVSQRGSMIMSRSQYLSCGVPGVVRWLCRRRLGLTTSSSTYTGLSPNIDQAGKSDVHCYLNTLSSIMHGLRPHLPYHVFTPTATEAVRAASLLSLSLTHTHTLSWVTTSISFCSVKASCPDSISAATAGRSSLLHGSSDDPKQVPAMGCSRCVRRNDRFAHACLATSAVESRSLLAAFLPMMRKCQIPESAAWHGWRCQIPVSL